ncbi:pyrroline-5-carboxylate reductase [Scrofimicrobium sp. R131]|uniref:Pyrroline-5-carboxylate reductase n=1 Tax=Scrofimicrobium appendicitidis TaxID=3079930 RepID=A0AAU7V8W2_9ACTO
MRLGFIGTGAMTSAIVKGLREAGPSDTGIFLYDVNTHAAEQLAAVTDSATVDEPTDLLAKCDLIVLGVKPHVQSSVLRQLAPHVTADACPALLSIAAGRTLAAIRSDLAEAQPQPHLIRVMPNVNAQIGLSMSAVAYSDGTPAEVQEQARTLLEAVGLVMDLPEQLFSAYSALAGCSPAWFFQIVDSLAQAGVKYGLSKAQALTAVTQSMVGSARLLQLSAEEGVNPSALIDRVCSPGGTTVAGLLAAQEAGLSPALVKAVDAAVARDLELG